MAKEARFDVVAWSEEAPGANGQLTGAAGDSLYRVDGDNIEIGTIRKYIVGVFATAASTGEAVRIQQPGLDPDYVFQKVMLETDNDPTQGYEHLFAFPAPLQGGTKATCQVTNATDEGNFVALLLADGALGYPSSYFNAVITGYSDTTLTVDTWTNVTVTWNYDLPPGYYSVVGCRVSHWITANQEAGAYRLMLPGSTDARPGGPMAVAEADHEEYQSVTYEPYVMWGEIGAWFRHNRMPNLQCCSGSADTDENIQMYVRQLEPGSK